MPKHKEVPEDFEILDAWEELWLTLTMIDKDLKKSILKGNKQSGRRTRKSLRIALELTDNILNASWHAEQAAVAEKKKNKIHKNTNGPGIKKIQELRESGKK